MFATPSRRASKAITSSWSPTRPIISGTISSKAWTRRSPSRRTRSAFAGRNLPPAFESYLTLVTVGGSTTHCFFLNEGQTWTAKLAARLEASLEAFWINNAGLDGHTTYGHLVLLQDYIVPLRPKVVLFLVGANDVAATTMSSFDAENVRDGLQFSSTKALIKSLSTYSEVVALFLNMYRSLTAYQATHAQPA